MLWVIVLLFLTNAATIITVISINRRASAIKEPVSGGMQMSEASSLRYSGRYFRDRLGLDRDQMQQFMQINPGFRMRARQISMDLGREKHLLLKEMSGDVCDTLKMNMISDSIGIQHACLKKITCKYYMDLKGICNDNQKKLLLEMFSDMFNGEAAAIHYGRGPQKGMGRGGQFNN